MQIPEDIRKEYPFSSHWFTADSHQLHYVDEGKGRAVVMFHGNPTWSFFYRNLIKKLGSHFRRLALDHMGCGLSDKPQNYTYTLDQHIENAVDWLNSLDLPEFDLVVHDWGGAIGMGVAKSMPEKVRKLVILNTAAFFVERIPKRIAVCRIPLLGDLIVRGLNGFAKPALTMAVKKPLSDVVKKGYILPYDNWANRIANLRFVQDIPKSPRQDTFMTLYEIESFLPQLRDKPMLIGWGQKDFCFTDLFLERWKKLFPDAKVLAYPNSGHYILEDEKDTLPTEIKQFLK